MKLLLCLLPVIVQARITIDIHVSQIMTQSDLALRGSSHHTITAQERTNFKLSETALRNGVFKLTGRAPDNVYLTSATPWNDLYKTYGWKEVTTILIPRKARVINVMKDNVTLNKKVVTNNESEPIAHRVSMMAKVEDAVTSHWEKHTMPFEADIDYNIRLNGMGNVTKFDLSSTWGNNLVIRDIGYDSSSTVEVSLPPKTNASVFLNATKVTAEVEVEYLAILDGYVATNYEEPFQGHHFWIYDIGSVVTAIDNSPQNVTTNELIVIEFYDDLRIIIDDTNIN